VKPAVIVADVKISGSSGRLSQKWRFVCAPLYGRKGKQHRVWGVLSAYGVGQ